jgi:hypothetical protein
LTKAKTKAQRRRRREITLACGDTAPQRATQGRRNDLHSEPADKLALTVRARLTGCTVEEARDTIAASDMGRCIRAMIASRQERHDLFTRFQNIEAAWRNYAARCLSLTPSPQGATITMLPDNMQTDQNCRVDIRSPDERDEAARRVWFAYLEAMMTLAADQRHALRGHLQDYAAPVWDADSLQPTRTGALAVKALGKLHEAQRS